MNKGFTLIELLVVVLIIGILSAVALPQYEKAVEKSRFSEAFVNGRAIVDAMNRAINERPGEYPNTRAALDIRLSGGSWNANTNVYTTDLFSYDISKGDRVEATRDLGGNDKYVLTYYNNLSSRPDDKTCIGSGSLGQDLCDSIKGSGYKTN